MPDPFRHRFGGFHEADAVRRPNPDGSPGAIVGCSARVHPTAYLDARATVWPGAVIGADVIVNEEACVCDAVIGDGARIRSCAVVGFCAGIGEKAEIEARVRIGDRARIGDGATVRNDADIGTGATIGSSAYIGVDARIGVRARIGSRAFIGDGTTIGWQAMIGSDVRIGDHFRIDHRVRIGATDWFLVVGPWGKGSSWATAVQSKAGLHWWIGAGAGRFDTPTLKALLARDHGGTDHEADCLHAIRMVEDHPGRIRHAARGAVKAPKGTPGT